MNCYIFWDIAKCRPFEGTDVSEEHTVGIIRASGARNEQMCLLSTDYKPLYLRR
jgi:hypothetical protein